MNNIAEHEYFNKSLSTMITIVIFVLISYLIRKIIKRYAKASHLSEHRANLISKYTDIFIFVLFILVIVAIWGVDSDSLYSFFSTTFAVIGVAFFAQWSILSNITSGIILFFSFPFRIGDVIKIHDKDFPIEAQIEDIKAFHTILRTLEGELITYPNNLLLQKSVTIVPLKQEEKEFYD
jgi:small-conductance mechanosensitive channel